MPFFARPNLGDVEFKQISGTTLTLSGQTRIATPTGLELSDGNGGYIPVMATGETVSNGDVLTYENGKISLKPGGGGSGIYYGASPTTTTVGGLTSGTDISGCTIENILQTILVPVIPISSSLSIATGNATRLFGDVTIGNLCWCACKYSGSNPISYAAVKCSHASADYYEVFNGLSNVSVGGTIQYNFPFPCACPATSVVSTSASYSMCAQSCDNVKTTSNATITWMNNIYCIGNGTYYSAGNCAGLCALMNSTPYKQLSSSKSLAISRTFNNEFFYYIYPQVMGTPTFTINGLQNNAWGNSATGTLFTMSFNNNCNYTSTYNIARSDSKISGTYCIVVS